MLFLGLKVTAAQGRFFDRRAVEQATSRGERKALSKFGAFVRRSARSLIRKRKRISKPGEPPSSHVGLLKQFLYFVFEPLRKSVIVGPALLNRTNDGDAVPGTLEHGGRVKRKKRRRGKTVTFTATYDPRPFMAPAAAENLPKVPEMFRDVI